MSLCESLLPAGVVYWLATNVSRCASLEVSCHIDSRSNNHEAFSPVHHPRSSRCGIGAAPALVAPAPTTFKAKYEGGVFGYNHKTNGTLTFDDANTRLVFRDEKQKEMISIPYNSITGAYADTHAVRPKSATIASNVPYIGMGAQFIKHKVQYMTIQFNDPDSNAAGITSFKLENREILASVLQSLGNKAGLTQRGEILVRKKS